MRLCYGLGIEAPILLRHAYRFDNYEARSSEIYSPAQQRGLTLNNACKHHFPLDPNPSSQWDERAPAVARPLVQFREEG